MLHYTCPWLLTKDNVTWFGGKLEKCLKNENVSHELFSTGRIWKYFKKCKTSKISLTSKSFKTFDDF